MTASLSLHEARLGAAIVFNLARVLTDENKADEMFLFTFLGGCAEVLDHGPTTDDIEVKSSMKVVVGAGVGLVFCIAYTTQEKEWSLLCFV